MRFQEPILPLSPADCLAVIPARLRATRLPGKPLADIGGRPMVVRVLERVRRCARVGQVLVAADDPQIVAAVQAFGGDAVLTGDHPTGTDRAAEVARGLRAAIIVNVQGDEPLVDPEAIDAVIAAFEDPDVQVSTAATPILEPDLALSPHRVKVVTSRQGRALYFSRQPVPTGGPYLLHHGIYGFRREALLAFAQAGPGALEAAERLEQLRFLERGVPVQVVQVAAPALAVDTPEDLAAVRAIFAAGLLSSGRLPDRQDPKGRAADP